MVRQGTMSLLLSDDLVLTDLAYEKAKRLGVQLLNQHDKPPAAPVRPYIAKEAGGGEAGASAATPATPPSRDAALKQRVREAVLARLGTQVDSALLDTIIERVLSHIGAK